MVTVETQTDCTITSFIKQDLMECLGVGPSGLVTDLPVADASAGASVTCVSSSQPRINHDVCSITSTSDLYPPDNSVPADNSPLTDTFGEISDYSMTPREKTLDEICEQLQDRFMDPVQPTVLETQSDSHFNLSADGNLSGADLEHNLNQLTSSKCKKSNWYAEETAQMCNLTRILLQMSTRRRERVVNRIKELFGETEVCLAELTVKNITVCRKRIASAVVMELTPMYKSKRIASRRLFKYLAQKITKSIMDQSYAPGNIFSFKHYKLALIMMCIIARTVDSLFPALQGSGLT